jgi:hypothetical protein
MFLVNHGCPLVVLGVLARSLSAFAEADAGPCALPVTCAAMPPALLSGRMRSCPWKRTCPGFSCIRPQCPDERRNILKDQNRCKDSVERLVFRNCVGPEQRTCLWKGDSSRNSPTRSAMARREAGHRNWSEWVHVFGGTSSPSCLTWTGKATIGPAGPCESSATLTSCGPRLSR